MSTASAQPPGRPPSDQPWTAARVAGAKRSRGDLCVDGSVVYWAENRPDEGGRVVVVAADPDGRRGDVSPPGVSVRSRVHEYGGGAFTVHRDRLFYVDQAEQRWWSMPVDGAAGPMALTPEDPSTRYADPCVVGPWLYAVEERHLATGVAHRLVAVATDGSGEIHPLDASSDFVAAPSVSASGEYLAWMAWDHPHLPWDVSRVQVARLHLEEGRPPQVGTTSTVVGGPARSVGPPVWLADGTLVVVEDSSDWWMPSQVDAASLARAVEEGTSPVLRPLAVPEGEYTQPHWVFGRRTVVEAADGRLWLVRRRHGRDELLVLDRLTGAVARPDQPAVAISSIAALPQDPGGVALLGSTTTAASAVLSVAVQVAWLTDRAEEHAAVGAESIEVETPWGTVPGLLTRPAGPAPPLVVFCHGGPTASAEPGLDPLIQLLVQEGLAVAVVDYRGSSGHGRRYREALAGAWGVADVADCVAFADGLARIGRVDGRRMAIRGSSAGGMTALLALCGGSAFAGAVSHYGVTELRALAADTHDFESRYLDHLIGPWPEAAARYDERSPAHRAGELRGRVLLLQGDDDHVVPLAQAEAFARAVAATGASCELLVFPGEGHGFRRAESIEAALTAELDFYRTLFDLPVPVVAP